MISIFICSQKLLIFVQLLYIIWGAHVLFIIWRQDVVHISEVELYFYSKVNWGHMVPCLGESIMGCMFH